MSNGLTRRSVASSTRFDLRHYEMVELPVVRLFRSRHSRATGITAYLNNGGRLEDRTADGKSRAGSDNRGALMRSHSMRSRKFQSKGARALCSVQIG
jgi:hypothetical protein